MIFVVLVAFALLTPGWSQEESEVISPEVTEPDALGRPSELEAPSEAPADLLEMPAQDEPSDHAQPQEPILTATPEPTLRPAPGAILLSDNFDNPAVGWLPRSSDFPALYEWAYVGGEYQVKILDDPGGSRTGPVIPGLQADVSIVLDARLLGDPADRWIVLACRGQRIGEYRLLVEPEAQRFALAWTGRDHVFLLGPQPSGTLQRGNARNRLELSCAGDTISAFINGALAGSVNETSAPHGGQGFRAGSMWIGVTGSRPMIKTAEVRFDNLVVIQR